MQLPKGAQEDGTQEPLQPAKGEVVTGRGDDGIGAIVLPPLESRGA